MVVRALFCVTLIALLVNPVAANPKIQHWQMRNGVRVYFVPSHNLPIVNIQVVFDAGSARDGKGKNGLSSLTNGLLNDGAGPYNTGQIAARFEDLGAQFGASSGRDMATVTLRSLTNPDILHPAVDMMSLLIRQPTFPKASLAREKARALIGIRQGQQNPRTVAVKEFLHQLYGAHPYAANPIENAKQVAALQRKHLLVFRKRYYVGRNAILVIVGDLQRRQAERLGRRLLAKLQPGKKAKVLPTVPAVSKAQRKQITFPSSQSYIYYGAVGIRRGDPDYFPLYVGNHILGGGGLVSRLSEEVREKRGLTYAVYSYFSLLQQQGPYLFSLQSKNETRDQAFAVMQKTFMKFYNKGPTEQELIAAKKNLTGRFPLSIDNNSKITGYLAVIGFYRLPLNYMDQVIDQINAVTVAQVRDAFQRRINPDKFVTVTVGGKIKK